MPDTNEETIRRLNDTFRNSFKGGHVMMTSGIQALPVEDQAAIFSLVRTFNNFTAENDPYQEHDFGAVEHNGKRVCFKIDYYAPDMQHGSKDPADPAQTERVMTIMLASEY